MRVPLVDLAAQHAEIADEVRGRPRRRVRADRVRRRRRGGGRSSAEYAAFVDADHCVGVANGTDALELALRAVGRRPGRRGDPAGQHLHRDRRGGLADRRGARCSSTVDDEHLLIDPGRRRAAPSPRAPRPSCPSTSSARRAVVEALADAARGRDPDRRGRRAGAGGPPPRSRAPARCGRSPRTSFYPGKNLGAAGDAGRGAPPTTPSVADAVRMLAAPRLAHQVRPRRHRDELPARHRPGGRTCGRSSRGWRSGTSCAARPRHRYDELLAPTCPGSGRRAAARATSTCGTSTSCASPSGTGCSPSWTRPGSAPASTTRRRCT